MIFCYSSQAKTSTQGLKSNGNSFLPGIIEGFFRMKWDVTERELYNI